MKEKFAVDDIDFLFSKHPTPMWIVAKKDLSILKMNQAALALFRIKSTKLKDCSMFALFPDNVAEVKKRLNKNVRRYFDLGILTHRGDKGTTFLQAQGKRIVLQQTGLLEKTTALATDINQDAIEKAKLGEYHKIRMIENEKNYREYNPFSPFSEYHTKANGTTLKMDARLSQHVTYQNHNLITEVFNGRYDLILCRNVMICFDTPAKEKLLQKFHAVLNPGGYLAIGFYDTMLSLIDHKLFTPVDKEARIFKRVD